MPSCARQSTILAPSPASAIERSASAFTGARPMGFAMRDGIRLAAREINGPAASSGDNGAPRGQDDEARPSAAARWCRSSSTGKDRRRPGHRGFRRRAGQPAFLPAGPHPDDHLGGHRVDHRKQFLPPQYPTTTSSAHRRRIPSGGHDRGGGRAPTPAQTGDLP